MKDKTFILLYKLCLVIIVIIFFLLLQLSYVNAYSIQQTTQDSDPLYIITTNTTEQPLEINMSLTSFSFTGYMEFQNQTINDSWVMFNTLNVTEKAYNVECGDYINCSDIYFKNLSINETQTKYVNITLSYEDLDVGTYTSWIQVRDSFNNEVYYARFRTLVQWGDIFEHSGVLELDQNPNRPTIIAYQGDLPQTGIRNYTIKTKENETMSLNCGTYLTCSDSILSTSNYTKFSVTYELPDNMARGTYTSQVKINTSYNTSMNITYSFQIAESRIQVIDGTVTVPKNPKNMTQQELIELFESMRDMGNDAIDKMNAVNKSNEVIVERNNTQYVVANVGEVKDALMKDLFDVNSDFNSKLYQDFNKEKSAKEKALADLTLTLNELNKLKENQTKEDVVINNYKTKLENSFFVWNKTKLFKTISLIVIISSIIFGYIYVDKKVHPGS